MKGNKFLAAALAASMVFSTVPATALSVFADSVSVEASATTIKDDDQVTVTRSYVSDAQKDSDDLSDAIKAVLSPNADASDSALKTGFDFAAGHAYNGLSTGTADQISDLQTRIQKDTNLSSATVSDLVFTDADHYTLKVVTGGNGTYTVTVAVTATDDASLTAAIDALPATYPSPSTTLGHQTTDLTAKIKKDLAAAGYNGDAALTNSPTVANAINTSRNGLYSNTINGQAVSVDLTYSSDQKMADTVKSLQKAITGTKAATTSDWVTTSPDSNSAEVALVDSAVTKLTASDFKTNGALASTTKLAQAIQSKNATEAVTKAQAVTNLKNYLDAQLAKDSVADNGVTVTVTAVNTAKAGTTDNKKYVVTDGNTGSNHTFLVTASIANDYADWSDTEKSETTTNFLVTVTTGSVKTVKATGISLADKTTNLVGDKTVITTVAAGTTPAVTEAATVVTMKAALTPADANTPITYTVADKDGVDVTSKFQLSTTAGTVNYVTDANGKAVKATTGAIDLVFKSGDEGTYTVTATSNGKKATATLTVNTKFKDVATGAYYKKAVDWAYKKGVTAGVSDTLFGTNRNVTRAQFVTWLYRNAVADDSTVAIDDDDVKEVFSDVATTAYYAKAVQWASENGIASGVGNGKFDPNADVTRAQAVTFIWRAKGKPDTGATGAEGEKTTQFSDVDKNSYYMAAVTWATPSVASGLSTTTFGPDQTATRAQAITFIARAYSYN